MTSTTPTTETTEGTENTGGRQNAPGQVDKNEAEQGKGWHGANPVRGAEDEAAAIAEADENEADVTEETEATEPAAGETAPTP